VLSSTSLIRNSLPTIKSVVTKRKANVDQISRGQGWKRIPQDHPFRGVPGKLHACRPLCVETTIHRGSRQDEPTIVATMARGRKLQWKDNEDPDTKTNNTTVGKTRARSPPSVPEVIKPWNNETRRSNAVFNPTTFNLMESCRLLAENCTRGGWGRLSDDYSTAFMA
jgi:hypothetical protein